MINNRLAFEETDNSEVFAEELIAENDATMRGLGVIGE